MHNRLTPIVIALSLLTPALLWAATPAKPTDPQIAHIAYTAGLIDVQAGKLALEKSKDKEIRAFAQRMIGDHTAVNDQALALVKKLNVTPEDNPTSQSLTKEAEATRKKLANLTGAAFDRAYVDNEVAFHKTVNNALSALASDQVEAAMLSAPTNVLAERQGFPLLVDLKDYHIPYSQGALATTRPILEERYDLVRDFVKAMLEARGVAMRDPVLAKRLLGQNTKTEDPEILDRSYQLWIEDLDELPYPSTDAVQTVLDQRAPEVPAARTVNPRDFVDDRIIRELDQSGFLRTALNVPSR